jgi:hypothetical protein
MDKRWLVTLIVALGVSAPSVWAQEQNPELPRDVHGLWWDPADPGWATAMFDHPSAMSSALLIYDHEGTSTWLFAPRLACYRDQPPWINFLCDGPMYRVTGPWFGSTFRASEVEVEEVGVWSGSFQAPLFGGVGPDLRRSLFLANSIRGVIDREHGQNPMEIQRIDPNASFLWQDGRYSGLWGDPDESGWGIGIFVQNNALYATLLVHGRDRQPRWYVVVANASPYDLSPDRTFEGAVFETRGYPSDMRLAGLSHVRQVGLASLHFGAEPGDPASLSYSIDGVQVSMTIVRP